MNRQNLSLIILQDISDDDNIVQIIENYFANSELEDDELLEAHRTLYVRNQNARKTRAYGWYVVLLVVSDSERRKTTLSNMATAHCERLNERLRPIYKSRERS